MLRVDPDTRSQYVIDGEVSTARKTLQTEVVDVLRWLDELAVALSTFPAFDGVPLDHVLESIAGPVGRQLPEGVRGVARQLRARWLNCQPRPHPYLQRNARDVGRELLSDLRVGDVGAQEFVKALALERMH